VKCACGGPLPFAARRCYLGASERVESARWWIEFALTWRSIGLWYGLNLRGIRSISQQAWDRVQTASEVT